MEPILKEKMIDRIIEELNERMCSQDGSPDPDHYIIRDKKEPAIAVFGSGQIEVWDSSSVIVYFNNRIVIGEVIDIANTLSGLGIGAAYVEECHH